VKYYNAETHKVLTSHNYQNINPPMSPIPAEPIEPNVQCEGKSEGSMLQPGVTGSKDLDPKEHKRKWKDDVGDVDVDELWKMQGKRTDYKFLHDPFPDQEDNEEESFLTIEEVYAIIVGDKLTSLEEAKNSPEWPQW
jgi:hypothetical protein